MDVRGRRASGKSHGSEVGEGVGTIRVTRETCTLNLAENCGNERHAWDLSASRPPVMT